MSAKATLGPPALIALALALPAAALAQTPPTGAPDAGAVQSHALDTLRTYDAKHPLAVGSPARVEFKAEEMAALRATGDRAKATRFRIVRIETDTSSILSAGELGAVTARYAGTDGTLFDLLDASEAINALYRARGYDTARAILPPQDSADGVFRIRLVEARLDQVVIAPLRDTRADYVRARLPSLKEGELVNVAGLEADLSRFNVTNDVRLAALVEPGATTGASRVVVSGVEPPAWDLMLQGDNAGRRNVGRERGVVVLRKASLTGRRDALTLGGTFADGTNSGFVSYSLPVGSRGGRLTASYAKDYIEVISGQFQPLDVEGAARDVRLEYSRPIHVSPGTFLGWRGQIRQTESTSEFGGANLLTNTVEAAAGGFDFDRMAHSGRWVGGGLLTVADAKTVGGGLLMKLNLDITRIQPLSRGSALVLRGQAQIANQDLLPGSEQFQLGGASSVRGYEEGVFTDDEGYFASAEWQFSLTDKPVFESSGRGFAFIDHGGVPDIVRDEKLPRRPNEYLTSAGFGLVHEGRRFSASTTLAYPFQEEGFDYSAPRLHVRFSVRPFAFRSR